MTVAVSDRGRNLIVGGAIALGALLCIVQPWNYVDAFVYPPHAKMFLLPFGAMPSGAAVAIWIGLNLFCLFRAGELLEARRDLVLLACLLPATLLMAATGYPAGFLALMAAIVVTQGTSRPGLAGLCLALVTVHPPLALAFVLLLLPFGYWRAVAVASAWTMALLVASVITFGLDGWADYLTPAAAQPAAQERAP